MVNLFDEYKELTLKELEEEIENVRQLDNRLANYRDFCILIAKYFSINPVDIKAVRVTGSATSGQPITIALSLEDGVQRTFIDELALEGTLTAEHEFIKAVIDLQEYLSYATPRSVASNMHPLLPDVGYNWSDEAKNRWLGMKRFDGSYWKEQFIRLAYFYLSRMNFIPKSSESITISESCFESPRFFKLQEMETPVFEKFTE